MKRLLALCALAAAGVVACRDDVVAPAGSGTGTIVLQIVGQPNQSVAATRARTGARGATPSLDATSSAALDKVTAVLSGATNRTVTLVKSANGFDATLTDVPAGTYALALTGFVGTDVTQYGKNSAIKVTGGDTTRASVAFSSFVPSMNALAATTTAMRFNVTFSTVAAADSYFVQLSHNASFSSPLSATIAGTVAQATVADTGKWYIRARARNADVPSAGAFAAPDSIRVVIDTSETGDNTSAAALPLGFRTAASTTVNGLNIFPATDADWFAVSGCQADTLVLDAKAGQLTPPSPLNTRLDVFNSGDTLVVGNSDHTGTDAGLTVALPRAGVFHVRVTGEAGTVGHYSLAITVKSGGGLCTPVNPIRYGQVAQGTLASATDSAVFQIVTQSSDGPLAFAAPATGSTPDLALFANGAGGNFNAYNFYSANNGEMMAPPAGGTLTFVIKGVGGATGPFKFSVVNCFKLAATVNGSVADTIYTDDCKFLSPFSGPDLGDSTTGVIVTINRAATGSVRLDEEVLSPPDSDAAMVLFNQVGSLIAQDDDNGITRSAQLAGTLSGTGTFRVLLTTYGPQTTKQGFVFSYFAALHRVVPGPTAGPLAGTQWLSLPTGEGYTLSSGGYSVPNGTVEIMTTEMTGAIWTSAGLTNNTVGSGAGSVARSNMSWTDITGGAVDGANLATGGWLKSLNDAETAAGRTTYWYRLPTPQEWEAAARGRDDYTAATGDYCRTSSPVGDTSDGFDVTSANVTTFGWTNSQVAATQPVGTRASCGGLRDMFGNVMEMVSTGSTVTGRGGSWDWPPSSTSAVFSFSLATTTTFSDVGFRLVRVPRVP